MFDKNTILFIQSNSKEEQILSEPIRVLQVVTDMRRGGLESMLMTYYRNIDRTKVQFDFLVHRDTKADYDDEILSLDGKIYHLPVLNPFSPSYYKAFNKFLAEHKEYNIIHVHQDCLSSIALKIAKKNGVPVRIGHSHNSNQSRNLKYIIKKYYMRSIPKYATELFACSKLAGDWMFKGAPYTLMNNAIDAEKFVYNEEVRAKVRAELNIDNETFLLGHVGRFVEQKNHSFLLDIFHSVKEKNSNAKLVLIGVGSLEKDIRQKSEELGLKDDILFLGTRSDVNRILQAFDCFVLPSLFEGLGIVAIEAQATGCRCFLSDMVPQEASLCKQNVFFIPLSQSADYWADYILANKDYQRCNTFDIIKECNYDIKSNAKWLEEYYISNHNKYSTGG